MSLVTDQNRSIVPVSLLREQTEGTDASSSLGEVGALLARGLEDYFTSVTGASATVTANSPCMEDVADTEVRRALAWDDSIDPVELRVDRASLAQLVDRFYGGDGKVGATAKTLSASEERFLDRLAKAAAPLLAAAWRRFRPIQPKLQDSPASRPASMVQAFVVACGDWTPVEIKFCYPITTLEWLTAPAEGKQGADDAAADNWSQDLTALVLAIPFPVRTILAEPEVPIAQLSRLAVGDVLSIRVPPQMDLCVAGVRIAKGTVGDHEGRAAFRLD